MEILKTRFPHDLSALLSLVKVKTLETTRYLFDLVKTFSFTIYSSVEDMVERLNPRRVKVLKPQQLVVVTKVVQPEIKEAEKPGVPATNVEAVEKQSQFLTVQDISTKFNQLAQKKVPDLEASVLKMIDLSRGLFNDPIENNPKLNQQLLDPFQTSVTE